MASMLSITTLNARQGDAIWIRWGDGAAPHQLLIDMGTEGVGDALSARLLTLPEDQRAFDVLVVTHVDRDHIGGVLTCLADDDAIPIPGLVISDVWFNGFPHLRGGVVPGAAAGTGLEAMGAAQGERLAAWLKGRAWNAAFGGAAVVRTPQQSPSTVALHDGLTLTVLGPTPTRLEELEPVWRDEVAIALAKGTLTTVSPGLESLGPKTPPDLETKDDLRDLATRPTVPDDSEANGASIVLLLQYRGRSVLLAGDAFAPDVVDGIEAVSPGAPLRLDAFKVPHHGSQNNMSAELVAAVDCAQWILSSDGTQFRHPDPTALARIISGSRSRPARLAFNAPSTFNGWWSNPTWQGLFDYETSCGTTADGITLQLL
jgi:beta-lactamase superfamily II metal-dependent hydrolase